MVMTRKKLNLEKDFIVQILDSIDFRGLTQDTPAGKDRLIKQRSGRILQHAPNAWNLCFTMTKHLGYEKNSSAIDNSGNSRYGYTEKTVSLENQSAVIQVSRDRNSAFAPEIIPNHEKRMSLFNDQIVWHRSCRCIHSR
jgi:hypothetical protein